MSEREEIRLWDCLDSLYEAGAPLEQLRLTAKKIGLQWAR